VAIRETRTAQQMLTQLGYAPGPVDGLGGKRTTAAVNAFQRAQGLEVTGIIDDTLISALQFASSSAQASNPLASGDSQPAGNPLAPGATQPAGNPLVNGLTGSSSPESPVQEVRPATSQNKSTDQTPEKVTLPVIQQSAGGRGTDNTKQSSDVTTTADTAPDPCDPNSTIPINPLRCASGPGPTDWTGKSSKRISLPSISLPL
jgi:peptidoglycan hydrolase-like protein with peptidoglycan-binding domain